MISVADVKRRNGQAALAASGLPPELFDATAVGYFQGLAKLYTTVDMRAEELSQCLSDEIMYNHRRIAWMPLLLRSDQLRPLDACSPCEELCEVTGGFVYEIDGSIEDILVIQNRISECSASISLDFELITSGQRKFLRFFHNPFEAPTGTWAITENSSFGRVYRNLQAWMYCVMQRTDYVRRYLAPLTQASATLPSAIHAQLLQLRAAPNMLKFRTLLGQISASPVAQAAGVVTDVHVDASRGALVTVDDQLYRSDPAVTPVVAVGDTVVAGDRLFDGFEIAELGYEQVTWDTELRVSGELFGSADIPYIALSMTDVPVVIETPTRAVFNVGPHTNLYWDHVYGLSDAIAEETYSLISGRSAINPYAFFVEQRLNRGFVAVRLRGELIRNFTDVVRILHKCLPPGRALLLQVIGDIPAALLRATPPCCVI